MLFRWKCAEVGGGVVYPAAMSPPKRPESRPIVRGRPASDRKRLAPEFEALVRGDKDWRRQAPRKPSTKLRDPRVQALVPGVANRDARTVFDARVAALKIAIETGDE